VTFIWYVLICYSVRTFLEYASSRFSLQLCLAFLFCYYLHYHHLQLLNYPMITLGGLVVSVLAIIPKVREILRRQNSPPFLAKFFLLRYHVSLLVTARELWWMNQEWLERRWGTHTRSEMVAVHGTLCTILPRNNNSSFTFRLREW
jgi:hypothetical protein